jgi:hypothetical protein
MKLLAFVLTQIARITLLFSKTPAQALVPVEKVWIHPSLIGYGKSRELEVGSIVNDRKGRPCVVMKQGRQGGLRLATERDMLKPLIDGAMNGKPTPRFVAMQWTIKFLMWKARVKRSLTTGWTVDRVFLWLFVFLPFMAGIISYVSGRFFWHHYFIKH